MSVVFYDNASSSSNYTATGSNVTFGGTNGFMMSALGSVPSMHFAFSGSAFVGEYAKKTLSSNASVFQMWFKVDSAATLNGTDDAKLLTLYPDATYTTSAAILYFGIIGNGSGFNVRIADPSSSFAGDYSNATVYSKGIWYRLVIQQTATNWLGYVMKPGDNTSYTTPALTYAKTQTVGVPAVSFGTLFQNAASALTGTVDISLPWIGNLNSAPSTSAGKIADSYQGYLQKYVSPDGAVYRPPGEGHATNLADIVSEGVDYAEKLAVQQNDQTTFNLIDNFALNNMLRSKSTVGNTNTNSAPSNALNLMAFQMKPDAGKIEDANWAGDAEVGRAQNLLWAHARWGSSSLSVGSDLSLPNYLQRALNVISDLRTYAFASFGSNQYLLNDSFQQGNTTVQIGPDYVDPAAFKLFARYDSANASFWTNAVNGSYDIITKGAAAIFSGAPDSQSTTASLNPNWLAFNTSTGVVSSTRSTYGDPNYGFNAFRSASRLYNTYVWYGDASALTALQLPKSFFTTTWAGGGIKATYNHDGSNPSSYELTYFYYAAYWSLVANDTSNTTASAINSGKLASLYTQSPTGSYYTEGTGGFAQYTYFGQSWNLMNTMQQAGRFINYGVAYLGSTVGTVNTATSATTYTITVGGNGVVAGHHLVLGVGWTTAAATISVSDTKSNTYQVDVAQTTATQKSNIVSSRLTTDLVSGDIITITFSVAGTNVRIAAYEWVNLAASSWLDQAIGAGATSTAPNSGNVTTTQADEVLFGEAQYANGGGAYTVGGSFTLLDNLHNGSNAWNATTYQIVSSTGTYNARGTIVSAVWSQGIATYKAAQPPTVITPTATTGSAFFALF